VQIHHGTQRTAARRRRGFAGHRGHPDGRDHGHPGRGHRVVRPRIGEQRDHADENLIRRTPHTEELTVYLEIVPKSEFPWREYYLSLGAISCAIVAALWTGLYPLTLLDPLQWATVIAVTFTASAVYHTYSGADMTLGEDEFSIDEFDR